MEAYERSLKEYNDLENQLSYAKDVGRREGIEKGAKKKVISMARMMLIEGFELSLISKMGFPTVLGPS